MDAIDELREQPVPGLLAQSSPFPRCRFPALSFYPGQALAHELRDAAPGNGAAVFQSLHQNM